MKFKIIKTMIYTLSILIMTQTLQTEIPKKCSSDMMTNDKGDCITCIQSWSHCKMVVNGEDHCVETPAGFTKQRGTPYCVKVNNKCKADQCLAAVNNTCIRIPNNWWPDEFGVCSPCSKFEERCTVVTEGAEQCIAIPQGFVKTYGKSWCMQSGAINTADFKIQAKIIDESKSKKKETFKENPPIVIKVDR